MSENETLAQVRQRLCKKDKDGIMVNVKCAKCGYRVRSVNHEEGEHHQKGKK